MKQNKVSKILFYIGILIFVISTSLAIYTGNMMAEFVGFNWAIFLDTALTGFISGMIFIALAEIIKLLHSINLKMGSDVEATESGSNDDQNFYEGTWVLDDTDRELASEMGLTQDVELHDIIPSPYIRYGVVILEKEGVTLERIVDFGGFKAEEVKDKEIIGKILAWYDKQKQQ